MNHIEAEKCRKSGRARRVVVGTVAAVGTTMGGASQSFAGAPADPTPDEVALTALTTQVNTAKSFLAGATPVLFSILGLTLAIGLGIKYARKVRGLA